MKSIATLISETPGCFVTPWPYDPILRAIPEFIPPDIKSLAQEFYKFHIFEEPANEGVLTTPGSIQFCPTFKLSIGDTVIDPEDRANPNFVGFHSCYTLANLGMANDQIILDLSAPTPIIRHFYYYSVKPLADYPILDLEFSELIRLCIAAGPDVTLYETLIWNETKTRASKPAQTGGDKRSN